MKRFIKVSLMVIISILLVLSVSSIHASSPYITKTLDRFGKWQETQDAYEPELLVKPIFDEKTLNGAQDLVIDEDDFIYIADTGNKRILILDADYNPIYSFGNDKLIKPQGLFKKGDKIYIADYGDIAKADTGRIYIYSYDKNLNEATFIKELARPSSAILEADNFVYRPQKIVVDDKETMYVISEASQQGVLMINKDNRFINFFASNSVKYTFWQTILRFLYQNNQEYLNKNKLLPTAPTNIMMDGSGYFYTLTKRTLEGEQGDNFKKVNIGGINFFSSNMYTSGTFSDATYGNVGNTYAVTQDGFVYEYDIDGNVLFVFGGKGDGVDKLGLFDSASGIIRDSKNNLIILDDKRGNIQIFRETKFASIVHEALGLYNNAKYEEALEIWEEVLRYNSMFDMAHRGVGLAYYMQEKYDLALDKFEVANDRTDYSEAYWQIRNAYLITHLNRIIIILFVLFVVLLAVIFTNKKYHYLSFIKRGIKKFFGLPIINELVFNLTFIKNPSNACFEVRRKKRISVLSGFIQLLLVLVVYIISLVGTGFLFNMTIIENTSLIEEALKILIPVLLFIFANYLTSSLMEGEGDLRSIFIVTISALTPVIVMLPIITILSNYLTLSESFLVSFSKFVMIGLCGILVFANIKEVHNFRVFQAIVNIVLTILMMVILILAIVMVYIMSYQVVSFISDIVKEVIVNG